MTKKKESPEDLLKRAGFKKSSTLGGYEQFFKLPTGTLHINIGVEGVAHTTSLEALVWNVAALAFKGAVEEGDKRVAYEKANTTHVQGELNEANSLLKTIARLAKGDDE